MYTRLLTSRIDKSFFLFGPRGVGKTSWVETNFPHAIIFDLLDSDIYTSLLASPRRLGDLIPVGHSEWVVLDEIQRVPELLNEVHRLIEKRKIKFVLTGSSARKLRRKGVNLLGGRAATRYMHPLTAAELGKDFQLERALHYGCLPTIYVEPNPEDYLKGYVQTYLREEVLQEGLSRNLGAFSRFLESSSFSQADVLNMAAISRDCAVSQKVVEDYFEILEDLLLAVRIPVFSRRAQRKMSAHPKFFFFDCGLFHALRPKGPLDLTAEIQGPALETLFLQQARAVNHYAGYDYDFFFWRTSSKVEVDFILYGKQGLLAFEIKRSNRLRSGDLDGLKLFLHDYPEAKVFFLYMGTREWHESGIEILNFESFIKNLQNSLENQSGNFALSTSPSTI